MIDESRTLEIYGYTSDTLKPHSNKRVVTVCEGCGKYRDIKFKDYRELCRSCSMIGKRHQNYGKHCSEETKEKIRRSLLGRHHTKKEKKRMTKAHRKQRIKATEETKEKIRKALVIKCLSEEYRQRMSARFQGISYDEWESFAKEQLYCPRFNEVCRESNREKYGRRCFICGLPESENIASTGKHKKLSVHHVDMNKRQGCDGVRWKLVPVCLKHHIHSELWKARIMYLLENVWTSTADE